MHYGSKLLHSVLSFSGLGLFIFFRDFSLLAHESHLAVPQDHKLREIAGELLHSKTELQEQLFKQQNFYEDSLSALAKEKLILLKNIDDFQEKAQKREAKLCQEKESLLTENNWLSSELIRKKRDYKLQFLENIELKNYIRQWQKKAHKHKKEKKPIFWLSMRFPKAFSEPPRNGNIILTTEKILLSEEKETTPNETTLTAKPYLETIRALQDERQQTAGKIRQFQEQYEALRQKNALEAKRLIEELAQANSQGQELSHQLVYERQRSVAATQEKQHAEEEIQAFCAQLEDINQAKKQSELTNAYLVAKSQELQRQLEGVTRAKQDSEQQAQISFNQSHAEIERLRRALEGLKAEGILANEAFEKQLAVLTSQLESERRKALGEVEGLRQALGIRSQKQQNAQKHIAELKRQLAMLILQLQDERQQAGEKIRQFQEQYEALRQKNALELEQLTEELTRAKQDNTDSLSRLSQLGKQVEAENEQLGAIMRERELALEEAQKLQVRLQEIAKAKEQSDDDKGHLESEIFQLQKRFANIEKAKQESEQTAQVLLDRSKEEIKTLLQELNKTQQFYAQADLDREKLTRQLALLADRLKVDQQKAREQNRQFQEQHTAIQQEKELEAQQFTKELDKIRVQNQELLMQLELQGRRSEEVNKQSENEKLQLQDQIAQAKKEKEDFEAEANKWKSIWEKEIERLHQLETDYQMLTQIHQKSILGSEKQIIQLTEQLKFFQEQAQEQNQQLQEQFKQLQGAKEKVEQQAQTSIAQSKLEIQDLGQELERLKQQHRQELDELNKEKALLTQKLETAEQGSRTQAEHFSQIQKQLEEDKQHLREDLAAAQKSNLARMGQIGKLNQRIASFQENLAEREQLLKKQRMESRKLLDAQFLLYANTLRFMNDEWVRQSKSFEKKSKVAKKFRKYALFVAGEDITKEATRLHSGRNNNHYRIIALTPERREKVISYWKMVLLNPLLNYISQLPKTEKEERINLFVNAYCTIAKIFAEHDPEVNEKMTSFESVAERSSETLFCAPKEIPPTIFTSRSEAIPAFSY